MHIKPMLDTKQQIQHLKDKGITFNLCSEEDAYEYLRNNNNYFKLTSYRKNYDKYIGGAKEGSYIDLDFGYLKDLAIIDMHLRYTIVQLALDIEHYAKLDLLRIIEFKHEDGYMICSDFKKSLKSEQRERLKSEIERNKSSDYCKDLFEKYSSDLPVWVFMEMIPFGRLVEFYGFCAKRYNLKELNGNYFLLRSCRKIRNASAHSSCILNDLRAGSNTYSTSIEVLKSLSSLSKNIVRKRMSNSRINQIVTLLYAHKKIVTNTGVHDKAINNLSKLKNRMMRNIEYYDNNELIKSNIEFLVKVIDIFIE